MSHLPYFLRNTMYQADRIKNILFHVVGWEQNYDMDEQIDNELTESESGLTFNGAHPLMTLENMKSIMPENWGKQYPAYSEKWWSKGNVCYTTDAQSGEKTYWKYIAEQSSYAHSPEEYPNEWEKYNILSSFLKKLTDDGIATAMQKFMEMKQINKETKDLLEQRAFFDGAGRIRATLTNTHKLVGFEIVPVRSLGVSTVIHHIGLQMAGATGTVRLYLFHSSKKEPIDYFDAEIENGDGSFKWFQVDWYLPYTLEDINAGGSWYIVYNQDDLPLGMQAINMTKDWSKEPCGSCTGYVDLKAWRELTKYLQVSPFMVKAPESFAEFPELWDVEDMMYTNTTNYGMNCIVSVGCDISYFIHSQKLIFQNIIQKQVAVTALRTLAMNPNVRVNRNQSNATKMDILYEVDGTTEGRAGGLGLELEKSLKALRFDTQGMDRICLTCNNNGVEYRTT